MSQSQKLNYETLDVFTDSPLKGNQLGLVHLPSNIEVNHNLMQKIVIEYNYSETVFLHHDANWPTLKSPNAIYNVQIFTPKSELPFAGHPTIGTAVWIFENLETDKDEIAINLKAGLVKATYNRERGIASASIPHNIRIHAASANWDRVVHSQPSLFKANPTLAGSKVPFISIVPGMSFALIDLSLQPDLLNDVIVTKDDIPTPADLDEGWNHPGLLGNVFYRILPDQQDDVIRIRQRVMVIDLEDPATGAGSAALTSYLALQGGGKGETYNFEIDQGVEMGRASKIFAEVTLNEDGKSVREVKLKGQAVEVMKGTLRLP